MTLLLRTALFATLFLVAVATTTSCKKRSTQYPGTIRIDGVNEPAELLVTAEKPAPRTEQMEALGKALEDVSGGHEVQGLPALDAFIQKYPDVAEAYQLRVALRCMTNDVAGTKADIDKALNTSRILVGKNTDDDRAELIAVQAKLAFLTSDRTTTQRDIDELIALIAPT